MAASDSDAEVQPETVRPTVRLPSIRVATRNYFSTYQLWGAENCAARAAEIEGTRNIGSPFEIEHRAAVLGAITMSVGFLEAMVNELFADAADRHGIQKDGTIAPLSERTRELMGTWWELTGGWERLLQKCQLLLLFAGQPRLATSAQPYQDAALLLDLRNVIVHYRPETVSATDAPHRLRKRLDRKFPDNPLTSAGNAWWPDHALGAGCAAWACKTARALADELTTRLGISVNYQVNQAAWWPVEQNRA
ncbi:MAG TPA: hypothetical protein VIZ67_11080 [Acidimicrobiales bacterium]